MGPIRTGFFYGAVASVVALVVEFRFLYLDPVETRDWALSAAESFDWILVAATWLFCGILAAARVRPGRLDAGVPYRSLLLRDATLAAVVVAVMVGFTLLVSVALQSTVFAEPLRSYATDAAPRISAYVEEVREGLSDPPPPTTTEQVEQNLAPPAFRDVGRSIMNLVLRALVLGTLGAGIGFMRGRFGSDPPEETGREAAGREAAGADDRPKGS